MLKAAIFCFRWVNCFRRRYIAIGGAYIAYNFHNCGEVRGWPPINNLCRHWQGRFGGSAVRRYYFTPVLFLRIQSLSINIRKSNILGHLSNWFWFSYKLREYSKKTNLINVICGAKLLIFIFNIIFIPIVI